MIIMKGYIPLIALLVFAIITCEATAANSFQDTITETLGKMKEKIDSYLSSNITEQSEDVSKELAKRKELHDKFSNIVYKESVMVTKLHGVADKNFAKFSEKLLKLFPQDKHSVIKDYLNSVWSSEDNDWKFFNIMYSNNNTNTIQYFSLYGNHVDTKSNIFFINFESNFRMPEYTENDNDLLAISSSSSTEEEMEDIKTLPKGMNTKDVSMLLTMVKNKAMKEFQKNLIQTNDYFKDEM